MASITSVRCSITDDLARFTYVTNSGNRVLIDVVGLLHWLLRRIHRRATGLALRAIRPLHQRASVRLADGSLICFWVGDVYWNPFIWERAFDYEPEIRQLLQRLKEVDYVFFDAGANIGYWSILASSEMLGRKKAIAIEGSHETFALLEQNCEANGHRFQIHRNAIFESDGEKLAFSNGPHPIRHVVPGGDAGGDNVVSLTLDTLARQYGITARDVVVIKLDVEGAEISALKGCERLLQQDTLVIYEDHGNDKTHVTTRYVLEELKLPVFAITDDGTLREIRQLSILDQIKTDPFKGYNFLACTPGKGFHRRLIAWAETSGTA